jgi:transcriptional regulator with XRE-family HTH domain
MESIISFGAWLKQRRRALDLTQQELARRAGCALVTLKKIERDERRPSKEVARRLADGLELPVEERALFLRVARAELAAGRLPDPGAPAEHVFQLVAGDFSSGFAPVRPRGAGRGNLPVPSAPLIGRERELAGLQELVSRRDVRLVTLTGPGGTGKTRLGLQVATNACGGSRRMRVAASSIANGKPSRRTQISATARAFSEVTWKSGLTAWARWTKSATASLCASAARSGR